MNESISTFRVDGCFFFLNFYSNVNRAFCKQTVKTLISVCDCDHVYTVYYVNPFTAVYKSTLYAGEHNSPPDKNA